MQMVHVGPSTADWLSFVENDSSCLDLFEEREEEPLDKASSLWYNKSYS
jgi:hypothetical protein